MPCLRVPICCGQVEGKMSDNDKVEECIHNDSQCDQPSLHSLCTKCMPEQDRSLRGYKGMIIKTPTYLYQDTIKVSSPVFNRSNIVQENIISDISEHYILQGDRLGKGSYGHVMRAKCKETGQIRAVKVIKKAKIENTMRMKREIQIMKLLDHPNIIKLFHVYEDFDNLYLVMEMSAGGELFDKIVKHG